MSDDTGSMNNSGYYPGVLPVMEEYNPNKGYQTDTTKDDLYFTQNEYPYVRKIEYDAHLGGSSDNHPFHKRYGTFKPKPAAPAHFNFMTTIGLVVGPTIIFGLLVWVCGQKIRFEGDRPIDTGNPNHRPTSHLAQWIWFLMLPIICIATCSPSWQNTVKGRLWQFILFSSLVAWLASYIVGTLQYWNFFEPYYETSELEVYPDVSPTDSWFGAHGGHQFLDAGMINFIPGSHVDVTKSYGFKNKDTFCVAPIVFDESHLQILAASLGEKDVSKMKRPQANGTVQYGGVFYNGSGTEPPHYDFWAVGTNCCSGHGSDFQCGEFNNVRAHSGLRLLNDRDRGYFRLAVQEAEAAHRIKALHPIFLYFMEDPMIELNNYWNNGCREFLSSIFYFFVWQLLFTWILLNTYVTGAWFAYEWPERHMQVESRRQSQHGYEESIVCGPTWWLGVFKYIVSCGTRRDPGLATSYQGHDSDMMY
jgi:hypothetical protein